MRKLTASLLLAAAGALASCSSDVMPVEACNYDIVCLQSQSSETGSVFSMYLPDSDREIVYTEQRAVIDNSAVPVGNRVMIAYFTDTPYVSGNITVRGYSPIHNANLLMSTDGIDNTLDDWRRDGIYLYSIWRSGRYINLRARLTYSTEPRELMLVVDAADVEAKNPCPTLRLVYRLSEPVENFERQQYASFDIGVLWDAPWIEGVVVELANTNLDVDRFTFAKNQN